MTRHDLSNWNLQDLSHDFDVSLLLGLIELASLLLADSLAPEVGGGILVIQVYVRVASCLSENFLGIGVLVVLLLACHRLHLALRGRSADVDNSLVHVPFLLAHGRVEFLAVGNHENRAAPLVQTGRKGTERLAVQKVGGFVQNDQVRDSPECGGQHELDLLTTGQTADLSVRSEFLRQTKVVQVLLDFGGRHGSQIQPSLLGSNLFVGLLDQSLKAHTEELVTGVVLVVLLANVALLDFVLQTTTFEAATPDAFQREVVDGLQLVFRDLVGFGFDFLSVVRILESPLDVGNRALFHVLFDVVEGVLCHVCDAKIRVDVVLALAHVGRHGFSNHHLEQRRLSCSIRSQDHDTRRQRHLQVHLIQLVLVLAGVPEIDILHLEELLRRRFDTLQASWIGEDELQRVLVGGKLEVMLGLWLLLDECAHAALVMDELAVRSPHVTLLVVDDVGANLLDECGVVTHAEHSLAVHGIDVICEPVDRALRQVIGGFVKQVNVRVHQNGTDQTELHLPTAGQLADRAELHGISEFQFIHLGHAHLLGAAGVIHEMLQHVQGFVVGVNIGTGIDVGGFQVTWPTFQLAVVDSVHERRLTDAILSDQRVTTSTQQAQPSLVQEDLSSVGQVETNVANFFESFIVVITVRLQIVIAHHGLSCSFAELLNRFGVFLGQQVLQVRMQRFRPGRRCEFLRIAQSCSQEGDVGQHIIVR
mmetsp:Transcript_25890/g.72250  ORF Transcript_25890/g.72250 Transcript_25890/m.72250 type:complete len:704 (+) Transcript_25890:120-2231(+)